MLVTFQLPERMFSVSGRKRNICPPSSSFCRCRRRFKSSSRLELNWRCRLPTKSRASLERIFSKPSEIFPEIFTDALIKPPSSRVKVLLALERPDCHGDGGSWPRGLKPAGHLGVDGSCHLGTPGKLGVVCLTETLADDRDLHRFPAEP